MNSPLTIKRISDEENGVWYYVFAYWGEIVAAYKRREDAEAFVLLSTVRPDS